MRRAWVLPGFAGAGALPGCTPRNVQLKGAVAWHGRLEGERDPLHPEHPVDIAASLKCPVLGLYGGRDEGILLTRIEHMRKAARAARKSVEIVVYPEAGHAFDADNRPSYDHNATEDSWRRMKQWFERAV